MQDPPRGVLRAYARRKGRLAMETIRERDLRERLIRRWLKIPAQWLKYAASLLMALSAANTIILKNAVIRLDGYTQESLSAAMDASGRLLGLVGAASVIDAMAGLAVPLFAFLLAEGVLHTSDFRRYLTRTAVTAVIGEFAYDFAMTGRLWDLSRQSPMLGTLLCLVMLYFMGRVEKRQTVDRVILQILLALCGAFWALLLRAEYALPMVLMSAVFYCLRSHRAAKLVLGLACCLQYPLAPMSFIALAFYNGKREMKCPPIVFYILYPAHLLVLGAIGHWVLA